MNDGGAAFPLAMPGGYGAGQYEVGMSLRDWFAGKALQGLLANNGYVTNLNAKIAYEIADAMLKERAK